MIRDDTVLLKDILESIEAIEEYVNSISKDQFLAFKNRVVQDAVVRRLLIIGEAAKNIPDAIKQQYPEIPLKKATGMRNILIHQYFGVDLDLVWDVVNNDLPLLKKQLEKVLDQL